eukprot:TRINITY_DN13233_c0_g1_i1.p1 TRINITY_DN13233_c0_g1~~TRINITY_DN13233_c0_g1_i1.p1  ORF type:complete len:262 (-),score=45.76 TRINITY_DN13233_c0_g1_i1:19-756(-)
MSLRSRSVPFAACRGVALGACALCFLPCGFIGVPGGSGGLPGNHFLPTARPGADGRGASRQSAAASSSPTGGLAAGLAALCLGLLLSASPAPAEEEQPQGYVPYILRNPPTAPPADDKAPEIPEKERERRRTAPFEEVKNEDWYTYGRTVYIAKCASCHPAGSNIIDETKSLFPDDLERNGYKEPAKVREIIRYGKGKMPGFAVDCASVVDYTQCGVLTPLDEATLMTLEDFTLNRANLEWRGRG